MTKIDLENGSSVNVTPDHCMLIGRNQEICYAKDVKIGMEFMTDKGDLSKVIST
jgi:intein/homing endonuclease